ncbi:MAG TPA: MBL fold metallo-hydrolase [Bryobacteraceae bacterium]|jgi:L-ascorbate metabolism protein UlaG (beta-lactamase superfamily)|nr:MBL fold metallo-hydrolase [Bryobacteraceae bacterium]
MIQIRPALMAFAAAAFSVSFASGQRHLPASKPEEIARQTDIVPTGAGNLQITPIYHASVLLEWKGKAIYVDPVSAGNYAGLPKAGLILITHTHSDHLDPKELAELKKDGTIIITPEAVAKMVTETEVLANGQSKRVNLGGASIEVQAIPMYNLTRGPKPGMFYHPKGLGNAYILTIGGKRIYFSGDTECTPEMKALKNIDVAFLCMNLPYTMTPAEAAECVRIFRPKIVYPYHYRGQNPQEFADALKGEKDIEVRLRNWYQ